MSSPFPAPICRIILGTVFLSGGALLAQGLRVGSIGTPTGNFGTL
jgi:hypothetical protein